MHLKLQIIGNIGRDAEIRGVNDQKVISFSVAHTESYKDQNGVKVENTTWVDCNYWADSKIALYLTKGSVIMVEGKPSVRVYKDAHGTSKAQINLRVDQIKLISTKKSELDNQAQPQTSPANGPFSEAPQSAILPADQNIITAPGADDDLPF